jgi:hypothetical protein
MAENPNPCQPEPLLTAGENRRTHKHRGWLLNFIAMQILSMSIWHMRLPGPSCVVILLIHLKAAESTKDQVL